MSGEFLYEDDELGRIFVKPNPRSRSVIFRFIKGEIHITTPQQFSRQELSKMIEKHRDALIAKLQKMTPQLDLNEQTTLKTIGFSLKIVKSERSDFYFSRKEGILYIACPPNTDFGKQTVRELLVKGIERFLRADAKRFLPIRLKKLAEERGLTYNEVKINSSKSRWGSCSSQKNINLSFYLMLLPIHLVDYVLLHELTHTLEMNHSPRFWAKLNQYSDGKSQSLRSELRKYRTGL